MKIRNLVLTMAVCFSITTAILAQSMDGTPDIKYRRSSLHTILLESDRFPKKDTVINAYNNASFPDKYNEHTIGAKSFDPNKYLVSNEERSAAGIKTKKLRKNDTAGNYQPADIPLIIDKYLKENRIADQLVAKWFNRQEDGSFNMDLIADRGYYDATEMEANIAKGSIRGIVSLADAGEELINNTFVVVSKLNFVSNEIAAAAIRETAKLAANKINNLIARAAAKKAADIVYKKTKEGYSVWTTSYLYKLKWNDSIAAVFYSELWMDDSQIDPAKKEAFENTDLFELEFIGDEKATSLVTFSLKGKRSEEEIVELSTIRNVDAVYAKLQKKYDVFKTKTPLYSGYPITAKIGMKEGLDGGEKFEVLEQTIDPETGLTHYERKGIITVDKKKIWDNRYNAGEEEENKKQADIDATTFKGGKNYYAGMLIRQLK